MDWRQVAFAAAGRIQSGQTAQGERARSQAGTGERLQRKIEAGAMAADDDQVRNPQVRRE